MMHIEIQLVPEATPEVEELVRELEQELSRHYPPEQRHGLSLEAIFQPHIRFFIARLDGAAIGCGGVALFSDFGELKRMYVRNTTRGQGVAGALLSKLTSEALAAGITTLRLETGIHQTAALRFYQKCGFQPCGAFEPYSSMQPESVITSVFLEKQIMPSD